MSKKPTCRFGNHRWDREPDRALGAKEGQAKCLDCQKVFGVHKKHKPHHRRDVPPPSPKIVNEALRAKWGIKPPQPVDPSQTAQPEQPAAPPAAPATEPKKDKVDLGEIIREEVPDLIIVVEQTTIEWLGRIPNDPSSKIEAKLKEAVGRLWEAKMPTIEVSPASAVLLASAILWGQMYVGADKKPVPAKPGPVSSPARQTEESGVFTPSPPSSAPMPPLSLVPDDGGAPGVAPSVLEE